MEIKPEYIVIITLNKKSKKLKRIFEKKFILKYNDYSIREEVFNI
jgi:predicted transcriptional regulator